MMTNPTAPLLSESEVSEISEAFPHAEYQPTLSPDEVGPCEICKGTIDDHKANCAVPTIHALIRDWRALKAERDGLTENYRIASNAVREAESNRDNAVQLVESLRQRLTVKSELLDKAMAQALELDTQNAALREQLAQTLHYFKSGNEGRCVTCGNLKLWQYHIDEELDPAASMRSLCVEKVKEYREVHVSCHPIRARAAYDLIEILQSLTLDQVEQKQK